MGQDSLVERSISRLTFESSERQTEFTTQNYRSKQRQTDVKLTGDAARLSAIFQKLDGIGPASSRIACSYFDTGDSRLGRRGFSLRLREQDGAHELTLKAQGRSAIHVEEWNAILDEPIADLGLLPPDAPRGDIGVILPEELQPEFTSEVRQEHRRLDLTGASVDVFLRIGHMRSGPRRQPVAELAFTLLDGDVAVMLKHIKSVLRNRRLTFEARSEAALGLEIANDLPPRWVKASKPQLEPADTLEGAMAKIIATTTSQITGNIAAAGCGSDPEGVHQLRVALRRLRSAFALFKDHITAPAVSLDANAKEALKHLGPARDLDVFLSETMPPVLQGDQQDPALSELVGRAEACRHNAYRDVRRMLSSPSFNRFLFDLLLAAEDGGSMMRDGRSHLRPVAVKLLQRRHRRVLKVGRGFADLATPERHEVRLALKKLRYACDYFQTLFPKKSTVAYLKRLESLQNDLGRLNDATVAEQIVDDLAADDTQAAMGGAIVKGWYRHRLMLVEPHMVSAWQDFSRARPFWQSRARS